MRQKYKTVQTRITYNQCFSLLLYIKLIISKTYDSEVTLKSCHDAHNSWNGKLETKNEEHSCHFDNSIVFRKDFGLFLRRFFLLTKYILPFGYVFSVECQLVVPQFMYFCCCALENFHLSQSKQTCAAILFVFLLARCELIAHQ